MKHLIPGTHQASTRTLVSCLLIFCASFMPTVAAITCSICGQSNLTAPGECTNQFQYDCLSNPTNGGQQQPPIGTELKQAKILCRTTRTKLGENQFAVVKECVTETEHLNRYPDGRAFGCETVQSNASFPTTYCVCDQDMCNVRSINEQLSQPQPVIPNSISVQGQAPPTPVGALPAQPQLAIQSRQPLTVGQFNRTASNPHVQPAQRQPQPGFSQPQNAQGPALAGPQPLVFPPQPIDEFSVSVNPTADPNQPPSNPSFVQEPPSPAERPPKGSAGQTQVPSSNQQPSRVRQPGENTAQGTTPQLLVHLNTERVQFLTDSPSNKTATTPGKRPASPNGFTCMVCGEGNLTQSQDCQTQNPLDCRSHFHPGANLFCFTKAITLPTGQAQIEKRCASEEQLTQELGIPTIQPSCFSGQDGRIRVDYCICGTSKCNQLPISNQANMYPPLTTADRTRNPNPAATSQQQPNQPNAANPPTQQTKMCYVCGESDQANPSDCSQQYEYDCSRQYPQGSTILCLTRQTKVASGRFNIEKRCITPAEHQLQYPDNEVTLNGCNEAWNGYVQYCVCQGDFCNSQNITLQQQVHHWSPKPVDVAIDDTFDIDDRPKTTPAQSSGQQPQSQVPRLPNGLLVPPSTRLPLSASQTPFPVTPTTKTGGRALAATPISNSVQEPSPPSSVVATTAKETLSLWDNRSRHDGQHRSSPSENSSKVEQNKKRGPTFSRQGNTLDEGDPQFGKSSVIVPGLLHVLALILLTLQMLH